MRSMLLTGFLLLAASACSTLPTDRAPSEASSPPIGANEAREVVDVLAVGIELQAYPAGLITGLHAEHALNERDVISARLAWNATDRGDFGKHDDECGGGPGGGLGWRRFLGVGRRGWLFGGRVDLWALEIDWKDGPPASTEGTSDVLVLQPSLEAGYRWRLGDSRWRFDLTGSFGLEINIDTHGEDVGQGAIGLLGVTLVYGH